MSVSYNLIIKNTMMLYTRMLITLAISLYTSRIVLNALGIIDFGIYSIVGGVVIMFSFLSGAMSTGTQRFLSFEIGKNNFAQLKKVFSMSLNIHLGIAIIVLILGETLGLWFLNTQLNIPLNRMTAANWVFQFSLLSFLLSIIRVPYNAIIIAREKMDVFATISILEVILKLIIVYMLQWYGYDKLVVYAILIFLVSLIISIIYYLYSYSRFKECSYKFIWEKKLYNEMLIFNGWNLIGNISVVLYNQGVNILLNIFFGPVVNAARGITYQINGALKGFVSNLQMAINPQIFKSYASKNYTYFNLLTLRGAKYSFFLLFTVSLPVLLETKTILHLWLIEVPEFTLIFVQLMIINSLIDSISSTLGPAALASGNIKKYQIIVGGIQLLILPISYIFLRVGYPPQITFYISILISLIALVARLLILSNLVNLVIIDFIKNVVLPIGFVVILSIVLPLYIRHHIENDIVRLFNVVLVSTISIFLSILLVGLKNDEYIFLKAKINGFKNRNK